MEDTKDTEKLPSVFIATEEGEWANAYTMNLVDGADLVNLIHDNGLLADEAVEIKLSFDFSEQANKVPYLKEKIENFQENGSAKQRSAGCIIQFPINAFIKFANGFKVTKDFVLDFHIHKDRIKEFFDAQARLVDKK